MDIEIREERPEDYQQTENVTREAFWNRYAPGCIEHYLLHVMRTSPAFVRPLDLVAVHGEQIIGNVVFVKGRILTDEGENVEVLTLGPISVHPDFQRRGVGQKLIEVAAEKAAQLGCRAILLCGDPDYYSKRGFLSAENYGIRTAQNKYLAALQVRELFLNALKGIQGRYFENPIYDVDPSKAEEFDSAFPRKEKSADTPCQKRLEELLRMQRDFLGNQTIDQK